uniref:INTS8 TPR repeats domain-containing protein n=1 Tax=Panagrolaimus superbus TaxID=310955 RepID=A0A914YS51_9BILA
MGDFIDKLPLLPVSIDLQNFDYFVEKEEFKKELAKRDDGKIIVTIKKSDLYLCCFAGFANLKWDIFRIAQGVPSMRIRSLLKQLILYAFPDRLDLIQMSEADIFKAVAAIPSHEFTEDNLFVAWFYARWILHLDRISRFPSITVKQTVANPAVQPDQVLLTAEQHGLCVQTTRPVTHIAAKFLQQLESLPVDRVKVPTENLNVWEENIEPNFQQSNLYIPMEWIIHRTRFDLFHANYAAAQFRTSRLLLKLLLDTKPDFSSVSPEIRDYISFDFNELQHFATCLAAVSIETQAKAVGYGDFISREMIVDEKAREQSLQICRIQLEKGSDVIETLRLKMAILCIENLNSLLIDKTRKKVPVPSEDHFNKFVNSNPSLFGLFSTIKPDLFEKYFDATNKTKFPAKFPERYSYSDEEVGDFISRVCPKDLQPLFFLLIGKAKQLQDVSLFKNWEQIVTFFLNSVAKSIQPNHPQLKELQSLLILKALNFKLRPAYTTISFRDITLIEEITRKYEILIQTPPLNVKSRKLLFTFNDFLDMIQNICEPVAVKQLLNYTLQIYNRWFLKSEGVSHILLPDVEMKSCFILPDGYKLDSADTRFDNHWGSRKDIVYQILDTCLKVSNRVCSNDAFVLRATGDYTFVINNFEASLRFYLNCVLVLTNHLAHPLTYNNVELIDDLFWKKVSSCLIQVKRPTQAAITCQLITNMFEILPLIHSILFSVDCEDASSAYFHLIGDIAIFELMSAAYIRQGFMKLQQRLVESVLSRSFHSNGVKAIHTHEILRRKSRWIRVLCSDVFDAFDSL